MIPQHIHRIWLEEYLGEDPIPETFKRFGVEWQSIHSDWTVHDWTDPQTLPSLFNADLYENAREIYPNDWRRFQADVVRLELLWHYGGVYTDMDSRPLAHLGPLVAGQKCIIGRSPQHIKGKHPLTNAFIACKPRDPFVNDCIRALPSSVERYKHRALAQSAGPWHLTRVYERGHYSGVKVLAPDALYGKWVNHLWNNARRKKGSGIG